MENYKSGSLMYPAGSLMLKWNLLDQHIKNNPIKLQPGDKVNVFINFESVLRNLTLQKGLNSMVNFYKQKVTIELESSILNLMANYRMYFNKEMVETKLYFYFTDLNASDQQMRVYNEYYRTSYHNRYMENPKFKDMGKLLNEVIIPEVNLILTYVNGCYFIKANSFDGSIIPYIISEFSDSKNVLITGDIFDTLYLFNPNFATVYIKRRFQHFQVTSDIDETISSIIKDESPFDLSIFRSEMYYRLLLSIKGSTIRNIKSAKGFGYGKFISILKNGIDNDIILKDFESIDSIIDLFPTQYQSDIKTAFQCTTIDGQYDLLSSTDIEGIKSQIIDKIDFESLNALNNKRFLDSPINLNGLCN